MGKLIYTEKILRSMCKERGLEFIRTELVQYKNRKRNTIFFKCIEHAEFGIQSVTVERFVTAKKSSCGYCNHKKLKDIFPQELAKVNDKVIPIGEYVDFERRMTFQCKFCGNIWETSPSSVFQGCGCPKCGIEKRRLSRILTFEDVKNRIETAQPNLTVVGEYEGYHKPIEVYCNICKITTIAYVSNFINLTARCKGCVAKKLHEIFALSQEEFENRVTKRYPNVEILGEYLDNQKSIECKCKIHNYIYTTTVKNLLYKGSNGCPLCNQSSGEILLLNLLKKNHFNINSQHSFKDCKHINVLRFDAYDLSNNIAYEYQGEQHYFPVDFAGKGKEWAEQQFKINQQRDEIKRDYCRDNNITLIEIPYWEFDNMKDFLYEKWKELKVV